ncbi:MAG: nucleotidyltransferase domain-containing protein [Thiogranum sp.]
MNVEKREVTNDNDYDLSPTPFNCHYQANAANPIYTELLAIVRKTFGVADVIREALKPLDRKIEFAFVSGSMAKGEDSAASDIDFMVVAEALPYADLMAVLVDAEDALGRPVNPGIYSQRALNERLASNNAFVTRVMEQPKLWIKGVKDDIRSFAQPVICPSLDMLPV